MRLESYIMLGWTPTLAVESDGSRRVLKVVGWSGGQGDVPSIGLYIGSTGYVVNIVDATDIAGNSAINYEHTQSTPSTLWVGTHNLGRKVTAVYVKDTGGNQWECTFESTNTTFEINVGLSAFAGTAILI